MKKKVKKKVKELVRLDLGCGQRKQPGFTGVDIVKMPGVDIVHDLWKFPWPFEDESVDEIFVSHVIEHVPDLIKFMTEVHRILKMGGKGKIIAPYYNSVRCWQDPTHLKAISENAFLYYLRHWREINGLDHYGIHTNFKINFEFYPNQEFIAQNKMAFEGKTVPNWPSVAGQSVYFPLQFALKYMTNVVDDIIVHIEKAPMDWKPEDMK